MESKAMFTRGPRDHIPAIQTDSRLPRYPGYRLTGDIKSQD